MTERKSVDWEAIEREYRAGQLTVVEIGRQHGLSHTAINQRAKRDGWTRNLADRVHKEVSARLVSEVSPEAERAAIEPAVARGVQVVRSLGARFMVNPSVFVSRVHRCDGLNTGGDGRRRASQEARSLQKDCCLNRARSTSDSE
jgi:hypothetical protein